MNLKIRLAAVVVVCMISVYGLGFGDDTTPMVSFLANGDCIGLSSLSGGDGVTENLHRAGRACIGNKPEQQPPSTFLYFSVSPERLPKSGEAVYVDLTYFDNKPGTALRLEYDSTTGNAITDNYRAAEQQWGGTRTGSRAWRRAVFYWNNPVLPVARTWAPPPDWFGDLLVHAVSMVPSPPADVEKLDAVQQPRRFLKPTSARTVISSSVVSTLTQKRR